MLGWVQHDLSFCLMQQIIHVQSSSFSALIFFPYFQRQGKEDKTRKNEQEEQNYIEKTRTGKNIKRDRIHKLYFVSLLHTG